VFLFEDLPATDRRVDRVFLEEVDGSDVYVGLFGDSYGSEDRQGISPTEKEFDRASRGGKPRLIFIKQDGEDQGHFQRHPKMAALIAKAESSLVRHAFS
jgi:hypothetical protein